jgi:hypothetical protein
MANVILNCGVYMKYLMMITIFVSTSVCAKDLKHDVDDWLAGRRIQILKTTVKNYWPDKTEKKQERISLNNVMNLKVLIDTNDELALLVKVPGFKELGKGRQDGVVVSTFQYLHEGQKLEILAVFEYKKSLNKRTLSQITFKTNNLATRKVRYALIPAQP